MAKPTTIAIAAIAATLTIRAATPQETRPVELLSACIEKEQCGYIDTEGQVVIEPQFEAAGDWALDAGRVWKGGLVGSIDRDGRFITPPQYESFAFNAGGSYSVPVGDQRRLTDHALRPINPELWDDFKGIKIDRRLGVEPEYIAAEREGRFALLDGKGRVIVRPRYDDIGWRAHEFPLLVKIEGQFGHIGEDGTPVSAERWSEAGMFYNGLAYVARGSKCGYLDATGAIAIPLAFDECRNFWTADAAIVHRAGAFALIDRSGRILQDGFTDIAIPAEDSNPIAVQVNGKWGAVDMQGRYRIEPTFDQLDPLDIFGDLLPTVPIGRTTIGYRAKVDGRFGLVGTDGSWILQPVYDTIDADYNGDGKLVVFRSGDKWGFVDLDTRKATQSRWDKVAAKRRNELLPVLVGEKWGYVDREGTMVVAPRFDQACEFAGDWACVAMGEKWGFINDRGVQVAPPVFRTVFDMSPERARILLFESRGWLSRQGRLMGISEEDLKRAGLKR